MSSTRPARPAQPSVGATASAAAAGTATAGAGAAESAGAARHTSGAVRTATVPWQVKFAALVLIWGSSFLFMKVGLQAMTPVQIATLRVLTGAAVVLSLLAAGGGRLPDSWRVWRHLLVFGFFLSALPFTLFAMSETRIASALAGIGNSTTPIATVLAGMVLLPHDKVSPRKLAAVGIGFFGVVLIAAPWTVTERPDPLGFAMAVVGGASYGIGWTYYRRFLSGADLGGLSQPAAVLIVGAAFLIPASLVAWWLDRAHLATPWATHGTAGGIQAWLPLLAVLALGALGTGVAFMFQYDVVRAAGPVVGSTITYLIPVVSVLLGTLVLGEHLTWATIAGFAVVLGAAWTINRPDRGARRTVA